MTRTRLIVATIATFAIAACAAPTEPRTSRLAVPGAATADSIPTCLRGYSINNGRCE
jgi:hypothetical protein